MHNGLKATSAEKLREVAETRIAAQPDTAGPCSEASDDKRLLHELQVHQIELEMQNEELRQVIVERNKMEDLLGTYQDLYDFAPAGYFTLDPFGIIRAVNLTGARFLGVAQSLLINNRLDAFISDETRPQFHDFLEKVFTVVTKETCEAVFVKKDHAPLFVQISALVSESGKVCRAVIIDISERVQAEEQIRRQLEEVRHLNEELTRFNNVAVGRELRMIKLKQEINQLCALAGLPQRFDLSFAEDKGLQNGQ